MFLKKGIVFIIFGIILIIVSVRPLFLIIQEMVLDHYINSRYELEEVIDIRNMRNQIATQTSYDLASPIKWRGNSIEVLTRDTGVDAPKSAYDKQTKHIMRVTIKVNGTEASFPTEAWLPQNIQKDSDYLSWLNILIIKDHKSDTEQMAIVQNLVDNQKVRNVSSQKWRILYVNEDKSVSEEVFTYSERGDHLLGVKLILTSSESVSWIGYKSDIAYTLPSIFFPLFYPTGSFILGLVFVIIGFVRYKSK
ncbi:hypothetical protein N0M98_30315 [Paenibacillus doosanensis]|uniref:hypothetical protein n=1 Tax=Paenibacillus doosanensis TaxID=1229154 RepID=UPI00217F854E|nr:hypothetical protein [Paenibacillus doosanensis]MCS7464398.1 hypothetical protein [Paenibacillus doosanensis]